MVLLAGAAILAEQLVIVAHIGIASLAPVVCRKAVVALGPHCALPALAEACLIASIVHRADLVTVTFNADVLIIQLCGAIAIVAQAAVLTVLASSVVFTADAGHHVQEVNVAATVGVAVALAVLKFFNGYHLRRSGLELEKRRVLGLGRDSDRDSYSLER